MGFWSAVKRAFAGGAPASSAGDPDGIMMYFECNNCHADVAVRLNKRNDLVREDGGPGALFVRKEVMDNKCFRLMRAEVWFDGAYNIVTADIEGGTLLTRDQYEERHRADAAR